MRHFGIDDFLIVLVQLLYEHQAGTMDEMHDFDISRGVRQGDILSVLLFLHLIDRSRDYHIMDGNSIILTVLSRISDLQMIPYFEQT